MVFTVQLNADVTLNAFEAVSDSAIPFLEHGHLLIYSAIGLFKTLKSLKADVVTYLWLNVTRWGEQSV